MTDRSILALVDAHVHLWCELLSAAAAGDAHARYLALAAWCPAVAAVEGLIPRIVGRLDGWDAEAAARGLGIAIERRRCAAQLSLRDRLLH
jgi:hypothetical protein